MRQYLTKFGDKGLREICYQETLPKTFRNLVNRIFISHITEYTQVAGVN